MDFLSIVAVVGPVLAALGGWRVAVWRNGAPKVEKTVDIVAAVREAICSVQVPDVDGTAKPDPDLMARVDSLERRLAGIQDDVLKHLNKASARMRRAEKAEAADDDDDDDDDGRSAQVPLDIPVQVAETPSVDEWADLRTWQANGSKGGII